MATANAVSRSQGISRADVSTRIGVGDITRRDISPRAAPPVRTDTAPRGTDGDELHRMSMPLAAEA
jgi:hypothetical protein